jgi:hypothetical protein
MARSNKGKLRKASKKTASKNSQAGAAILIPSGLIDDHTNHEQALNQTISLCRRRLGILKDEVYGAQIRNSATGPSSL